MLPEVVEPQDPIADPTRLAAVLASELLDTEPESAFDELAKMAAIVVGAPLAFVTIVDDAQSFWKSCYGVPAGVGRRNTVDESFCKYVVRTERELVIDDASIDARTEGNPSVVSMGVRAWLGFPIYAANGQILGSFCAVDLVPRKWTERDVEVMRTFAAAASREIALREALRNERRSRTRATALVRTLQESMLPPALVEIPGLDVAAIFHPAGTGEELIGDFYDLFAGRDGEWSFILGDVCGKGPQAAKLAAFARHTVGALAMHHGNPADVLSDLNEILIDRSPTPDVFLTAMYGTLALRGGTCAIRLARGGQPPPIVRRRDGTVEAIDVAGQLIGVLPSVTIDEVELVLERGEMLVVYTDGVDEARAGSGSPVFGMERLLRLIADAEPSEGARTLAKRIEAAALDFSGGVASDDIAALVIGMP